MKLFLIVVGVLVPLITARSFKSHETDSCIADYLTSKLLIEENLSSGDFRLNELCTTIVEVTKHNIFEGVQQQLMSDRNMREDLKCIVNHLKKSDFVDNLLVAYVYEVSAKVNERDRERHMRRAESKISKTTFDAFMVCQADLKFSKLFEDLFEEDSTEEKLDPKADYCFRKHIVEKHLITVEGLKLELNPKDIDTSVDCEFIFPKALREAENELVKAITEESSSNENDDKGINEDTTTTSCVMTVVQENKFIDRMLPYDYVSEFTLEADQREAMRKNFIMVMSKLAEKTSKCFLR